MWLLALVLTSLIAQGGQMRFQGLDKNNDGRITRDEWPGSDRSFANHDWNGDGVLSEAEVRAGGRQGSWEAADHNPNRFERNLGWTRANFTAYDHNRDGRLTANEWHFDTETFRRIDRNRDGAVSLQEFLGDGDLYDDDRDESFDDMDWNNNGRVERSEWHGSLAAFRALDRNNDGVLTRYEVVGSNPSFESYDEFANLDYDRDGRLERGEWHWSLASFNRYDTNNDGIISRREFEISGGTPAGAATNAAMRSVQVDSRARWTDTGVDVRAGDLITLNASGTITLRQEDAGDTATPAGSTRGRTAPDAPVSGQLAGALLAKIGGYPPMFVGNQGSITAPVTGRLYLGVNDDHLPDNSGAFTVTVGLQGRTTR